MRQLGSNLFTKFFFSPFQSYFNYGFHWDVLARFSHSKYYSEFVDNANVYVCVFLVLSSLLHTLCTLGRFTPTFKIYGNISFELYDKLLGFAIL